MLTPIHLDGFDVALAAALVLLNAVASIYLQLHLHRQMLWAAARMVVQLLLVGYLLRLVFHAASPWLTLIVMALMAAAAAREVAVRPVSQLARRGNYAISIAAVSLSGITAVLLALLTAIRPDPWYDPRYAIPLVGIVLGSVLNAASLGLDTLFTGLASSRGAIEAQLALGRGSRQAMSPLIRTAMRRGMIPVINQMSAAGIITLPGIMTGQLLAGLDPVEAVKYQILLLFLLTGASALAVMVAVHLGARAVTDDRDRLRMDRFTRPS